ncbi:hypothetical protein [uncultured Cetobacterium sp.]|uniref:hypothetical protein n=1 Tax=uncultured Cetobacterium sp. TaxID=527638 RepID=UPI0025CC0DB7|nr:hypothetical protein [uncultured Cetobacterium sp.]
MNSLKVAKYLTVAIFSVIISKKVFPQSDITQYEEAYIEIKSKSLKDDFFMVRYDFESDEIFIPIKGLFYFLEIYSVNIDLDKKVVEYQIDEKKYKNNIKVGKSFILDGDLYVNLEGVEKSFDFGELNWSSQDLKLILNPKFILPFEIRERGKVERLRLNDKKDNQKVDYVEPEAKILSPGLLKLGYSMNDIKSTNRQFNLEYGTQFLYGDFYINYNLEPDSEVRNTNLTYNNVYEENDFIIGDFYLKSPDFLNIGGSLRGVSFGEKNTYSSTSGNVTTIKGEAQGADVIELYQNDILLDYKRPTEKNFIFEVRDRSYGGDYSLKIYYTNGQIENRKVYTVGDTKILNKNQWSYNFQGGQDRDDEEKTQIVGEISYGATKNFTLGVGLLEVESVGGRKYSVLKNELIYRMDFSSYPILINFQNFYEYEQIENSYELRMSQKIKKYNLTLNHFRYSDYLGYEDGRKEYNSIGISRDFVNTRLGLGYQEEISNQTLKKETGYYVSLENRGFRNYSFFLDAEVNFDEENKKRYSFNPGISYSGISKFTTILQANIEGDKKFETDYSLKFLGRRNRFKDTSIEYVFSSEIKYNEEEKSRFLLDFTIYFDDYIYLELPMSRREAGDYTVGINAEKVFDLGDVKRDVRDRQVDNSWIYGKIYIDSNDNGIFDEGETLLPDVALIIDGKRVTSDRNGNYFANGLLPLQSYKIEVDRKSIDPMLTQVIDKREVKTKASIGTKYDVGVQAVSMVTGNIIPAEGISSQELIRILSMTNIALEKDGELYQEIDPEFDGLFFFESVLPGSYKMKFIYLGSDNVTFSEESLDVNIKLQEEDEGEYFEGFDVVVDRGEVVEEPEGDSDMENDEDDGYDLEDILNNF